VLYDVGRIDFTAFIDSTFTCGWVSASLAFPSDSTSSKNWKWKSEMVGMRDWLYEWDNIWVLLQVPHSVDIPPPMYVRQAQENFWLYAQRSYVISLFNDIITVKNIQACQNMQIQTVTANVIKETFFSSSLPHIHICWIGIAGRSPCIIYLWKVVHHWEPYIYIIIPTAYASDAWVNLWVPKGSGK